MPVPTPKKDKNNGKGPNWGRLSKTLSFWILILLIPVALIQLSGARADSAPEIRFDEYRRQLQSGNISEVTMTGGKNIVGSSREPQNVQGKTAKRFTVQLAAKDSPTEV